MNYYDFIEQFMDDSRRVRALTLSMLAELYFPGDPNGNRKAKKHIDRGQKDGLAIKWVAVTSNPSPSVTKPLAIVKPHHAAQLTPAKLSWFAGKLSHKATSRYNKTRPGETTLYTASKRARRIAGGPELTKHFSVRFDQSDHDLLVLKASVLMKRERPELWEHLRCEDIYAPFYELRKDKIPDALVCGSDYEQPSLVVDSISRYTKSGVESLIRRWCTDVPEGFKPTTLEMV